METEHTIKKDDYVKVTDGKPINARYKGKIGKVVSVHPRSNMYLHISFKGCGLSDQGFKECEVEKLNC